MKYISKSLEWVPLPGLKREQIIEEMTGSSVGISDKGDHVWVAAINNLGTVLFCYALQLGPYQLAGREVGVWHVKRIPETAGPDVYDCPIDILEMCKTTNEEWREQVRRWHDSQ